MKLPFLAALAALALVSTAHAEAISFPSDAPVATMTFPDDWKSEETESGIQTFSPDDAISLYVDVATVETTKKIVDDAIAFLKENGVTIDESSLNDSNMTINGMEFGTLGWNGKDADDADISIGLAFVQPSPESMLVITYWGAKETEEKHGAEINEILGSIKPGA